LPPPRTAPGPCCAPRIEGLEFVKLYSKQWAGC
jgi:hypothetical protein